MHTLCDFEEAEEPKHQDKGEVKDDLREKST